MSPRNGGRYRYAYLPLLYFLISIHSVLAELELKSGFNVALIVSLFTHHGIHDRGTYNRSRSSGEPFNLAILDEEFRKVLSISSDTRFPFHSHNIPSQYPEQGD